MPPGGDAARIKRPAAVGGMDFLSALPDELLRKVLSFLPSRQAVRTSVLAHRWRHEWKEVPSLRVTSSKGFQSENHLNKFINHLLILRNRSLPFDVVDIKSYDSVWGFDLDEACRYIDVWIQHALNLKVQELRVCITSYEILEDEDTVYQWRLPNKLLTSEHLTKLELIRVELKDHSLDFSSCPVLKYLKMEFCNLLVNRIVSPSIKHLIITCCGFKPEARTRISAPSLISLQLVDCRERTPFLESMPLLVSAFVRLRNCCDCCANSYETGDCGDDSCEGCTGSNIGKNTCVLLQSLSGSTNLELTAETAVFILRKDLTRCPVFSKLKTLLLNDWCITANLGPLISFLQHSPNLEKLTLQLPEIPEDLKGTGGSYDINKQPFLSKRLTVEVKCHKPDERVRKILGVLCSCGIPPEQIKILQLPKQIKSRCKKPWPPGSLSFEQKRT
ncbi:unnamed protein product [Urochloa decumbens]|uniref:F-box domain-containing protein n=1 Tax=Urochloa decumbens TaxID=240449 RepID=A0ABC9B511_9POAL